MTVCKKCGGGCHKCGTHKIDGVIRYFRFRCSNKMCRTVTYVPADDREKMTFDEVQELYKAGKLKIWHQGKAWGVE